MAEKLPVYIVDIYGKDNVGRFPLWKHENPKIMKMGQTHLELYYSRNKINGETRQT